MSSAEARRLLNAAGAESLRIEESNVRITLRWYFNSRGYVIEVPIKRVVEADAAKMAARGKKTLAQCRAELVEAYTSVAWSGLVDWLECRMTGIGIYENFEQCFAGHLELPGVPAFTQRPALPRPSDDDIEEAELVDDEPELP